ncbi:MAG: short-chain dehydrogenase, partial [Calditrichaceae bacterium]
MNISGSKALVLGGWGLVGLAVCKKLIDRGVSELIILSLEKYQAEEAVETLKGLGNAALTPEWGNIFVRDVLKDLNRTEIIENPENRNMVIDDVLNDLNDDILKRSFLYQVIDRHKPDIIIDCVNSATALAYQDIFTSSIEVRKTIPGLTGAEVNKDSISNIEKLLLTQYVPQLIRHIQVLYEIMKKSSTKVYVKVGTSGTG